jgi:ABC-type transport system involved in multi-copper enzyme maturation permease subunit
MLALQDFFNQRSIANMNLGRIFVIATHVFREVIRDRVLYLIGFFAVLLLAAMVLLPEVATGTENKIILDLGLAAMGILGLVIAIFVGTGLVNKEIEKRTVLVLIAKPVSRAEFILGKHLGLSALLALLISLMAIIYLVILLIWRVPFPLGSILISIVYLFFELSLITAFAILFGVFTNSLLAILLTFGIYLMGHLSPDLIKLGQLSKNPGLERFTQGLYLVLPDLSRLDLKNQAVYGIGALPNAEMLLLNVLYAFLYIALLLSISIVVFSRREF